MIFKDGPSVEKIILDSAPMGILLLDRDRRILKINRWVEERLGVELEGVKGSYCYELQNSNKKVCDGCEFFKAVKNGKTHFYECISKFGVTRNTAVPIKENGEVVAVLEIVQDRGNRNLEEKAERYRYLWENVNDMIYLHDLEGNFIEMNRTAKEILGYTDDEVRNLNVRDVVDERYLSIAIEKTREMLKGKPPKPYEVLCYTKDGKPLWVEVKTRPIYEGRKVVAVQGIARDITERKRLEKRLRESKEWFKALVENLTDIIIVINEDGTIRYISPSVERVAGYKQEEVEGKSIFTFVREEDYESVFQEFVGMLRSPGVPKTIRLRAKDKEGNIRYVEGTGWNLLENPLIKGIVINLRDVTEKVEAEERLRENERKYRYLWENANDFLYIHDLTGRFIDANPITMERFGYTRDDVGKVTLADVLDERYLPIAVGVMERLASGETIEEPIEFLCKTKKGEEIWLEAKFRPIVEDGRIVAIQGIARDITERRRMEEKLRESEEMFRTIAEKSFVGIYLIQDGVLKYVNPKLAEVLGYEVDELVGKNPMELIHPADREVARRNIEARIRGEVDSVNYRLRMLRKDGKTRVNEVYGSRTTYKGKPAILETLIDITDEEERRRKLEEYERFYKNAQDLFFILDSKGRFLDVNPKYAEMLGYSKEELIGHTARKLMDLSELEMVRGNFERVLRGERVRYTAKAIARDGKTYIMDVSLWPVFKGGRVVGAEGILRDVTEFVRLNKMLNTVNNVNKLLVREKDKIELIRRTSEELSSLGYFSCWLGIRDGDRLITTSQLLGVMELGRGKNANCVREALDVREVVLREGENLNCSECEFYERHKGLKRYAIPMVVGGEARGSMVLYSDTKLPDDELELLKTLANDLAFTIKAIELETEKLKAYEQIERNIENYAILIDHIRNPLAAILGLTELRVKDLDPETAEKIAVQVERIAEVIRQLDEGWIESENIRKFLRGEFRRS